MILISIILLFSAPALSIALPQRKVDIQRTKCHLGKTSFDHVLSNADGPGGGQNRWNWGRVQFLGRRSPISDHDFSPCNNAAHFVYISTTHDHHDWISATLADHQIPFARTNFLHDVDWIARVGLRKWRQFQSWNRRQGESTSDCQWKWGLADFDKRRLCDHILLQHCRSGQYNL